jgi:hypothetical protein
MSISPEPTSTGPGVRSHLVRFLAAFAVIGVVMIAPMLLIGSLVGVIAAMAFPFGTMAGLFASTGDGRGVALRLMPLLVIGGSITAITAGTWWWVPALALSGVAVGALATRGWAVAAIEVAICVTTADHVSNWGDLWGYALFVAAGYGFGILVARLAGAPEHLDRPPLRHISAPRAAALGGAALAVTGALGLAFGWNKAFWLPMSFLILLEFYVTDDADDDADGVRMIVYRFAGTIGGMVLLVPLVVRIGGVAQFLVIIALLAAAVVIPDRHYWVSAALITTSVVIFSSIGADPLEIGRERVWATVTAGLVLAVTVAAFSWIRTGPGPFPAVAGDGRSGNDGASAP